MRCWSAYAAERLVLLFLLLGYAAAQSALSCSQAIEAHEYAISALGDCENPATQNTPICGLIGEYESGAASSSSGNDTSSAGNGTTAAVGTSDQLQLISNPAASYQQFLNIGPWQNYLTQSVMSMVADLGEVSYVLSEINQVYGTLSGNVTTEEYYGTWQQAWWKQADANLAAAEDTSSAADDRARQNYYWKAASYYFAGCWPNAFSDDAIQHAFTAVDAFKLGLDLHLRWQAVNFSIPFDNGTAVANLPGILITPDALQQMPLVIITGGTDYPKEQNALAFSFEALERGYAVLVYDGPGQGEVIKRPPYMPFYPAWDEVLSTLLDFVETNLTDYVLVDNIAQSGLSLGGYLGARACTGVNTDRLAACVLNPPQYSVPPAYARFTQLFGQGTYGALQYVAQTDPALLPPGYADIFDDYTPLVNALLLTCDAASGAPELVGETFANIPGPIDPELTYLAAGYGGTVSGDKDVLYSGIWQGFRNLQDFGDFNVSNIETPVIGIKGTEDNLLGGQEDDFFAMLSPAAQDQSVLITFDSASGGALHDQVGSPYVLAARTFAQLNPYLQAETYSSAAPSPSISAPAPSPALGSPAPSFSAAVPAAKLAALSTASSG